MHTPKIPIFTLLNQVIPYRKHMIRLFTSKIIEDYHRAEDTFVRLFGRDVGVGLIRDDF